MQYDCLYEVFPDHTRVQSVEETSMMDADIRIRKRPVFV